MKREYIPIETVLNVNDDSIRWYHIPNFNGYEISNIGIIRSMKHFKKYPFGIMIRPVSTNNNGDIVFELSDNNNERVKITLSELKELSKSKTRPGYPRKTFITNVSSRNQKCTIKKKQDNSLKNTIHNVSFTIIED